MITLLSALAMSSQAQEASGAGCLADTATAASTHSVYLDVDACLFLRNNEYKTLMDGYTLPGYHLIPKLAYEYNKNIRFEVGAFLMHYWGAQSYPNDNYVGLPQYDAENNSKGVHVLPFIRAVMTTNSGIKFVLGDIYNDGAHHMLRPMYAPELELTSDPEAGFQILYSRPWLDFDAWIDWRSFIFRNSPNHEMFFAGLSTRFNYTRTDAPVNVYSPLQMTVQHLGGEFNDDVTAPGIMTMMNGAVGLGAVVNVGLKWLNTIGAEADFLYSKQMAGDTWAYPKGWSVFAHTMATAQGFKAELGYYRAHDFVSILGVPLWGSISTKHAYLLLKDPSTAFFSLEYTYQLYPGFSISADMQFFKLFTSDAICSPDGLVGREAGTTSFGIGVTMRLSPSFLLRQWRK